jgi:signal peptidase I
VVAAMVVAAAAAVLVVTLWMPVIKINGSSMSPTLEENNVVILLKTEEDKLEVGDLIAFYDNNKILVKRIIAQAGDWVSLDADGNVSVNGVPLEEPYLTEKALGECDIQLPYQVPDQRVFVMGDNRSVSVDSRSTQVGCVSQEQIVGKLLVRVWPLTEIGIP